MAPEVMRAEEYDESSDVYSFGMVLWELVTNKIPYIGLKVTQIVGSVGYGDKQVEIPEKGNKTLIEIMKLCLNKDRTKRPDFQSIVEMMDNSEKAKIGKVEYSWFEYCR
jgi:serine/threonine protein kinase